MNRYIWDRKAVICLDGIRMVQKIESYQRGFSLQVTYKGNNFVLTYPTEEECDSTFREIIRNLEERNKRRQNESKT